MCLMGQYKVPQDVEAEDKIIGVLTLKQFIYAVIGVAYGLLTFQIFKKALILFVLIGVPPTAMMLLLGLYQREGQPFEAYFLALVNFWFKPRQRIWLKEDVAEVFKIEQPLPKPEEAHRDPREVRGQLEKLAQIVDTRGWESKQPEVQEPTEHPVIDLDGRLKTNELDIAPIRPTSVVNMEDDMLDLDNNQSARNLSVLIEDSEKSIHDEVMQKIREELPSPIHAHPGDLTKPTAPTQSQNLPTLSVQPNSVPTPSPETAPTAVMQSAPIPPAIVPSAAVVQTAQANISEMTTNPIADILKRAMETPDLKVSQVSQIAAQATSPAVLVEGQAVAIHPDQPAA